MFFSRCRKNQRHLDTVNNPASRQALAPFFLQLWIEPFEDRTRLSAYQWLGTGGDNNWNNPGNWNLLSGAGTFPNAIADIARFTGSYSTAQTVLVNQAITVGEIDFGSSKDITITGANILTLLNSGSSSSILDVGLSNTNSGVDVI